MISTTILRASGVSMKKNMGSLRLSKEPCTGNGKQFCVKGLLNKFTTILTHGYRDVGKGVSKKQRDECWRRSEVYRCWMLDKVFETSNDGTVVIMPLPIEVGQPNYRDAPLS